jgi:hypothetical protein
LISSNTGRLAACGKQSFEAASVLPRPAAEIRHSIVARMRDFGDLDHQPCSRSRCLPAGAVIARSDAPCEQAVISM